MDKRVNNLGCFILYGKTNHFFPPFFSLIHLHEFMRKVFVYKEKGVRITKLVTYCNYFKKIIFYCVKITQESHNFNLKLACIVCVRNIPLYVISITLLYSNEWWNFFFHFLLNSIIDENEKNCKLINIRLLKVLWIVIQLAS